MPGAKPWTDAEIATFRRLASGEASSVDDLTARFAAKVGRPVTRAVSGALLRRIGLRAADVIQAYGAAQGGKPIPVQEAPPPAEWPPKGYEPHAARPAKVRKADAVHTVVISDVHRPYHLRSGFDCARGIIRDLKPDRVVLNGDVMEMEALSRHPKSKPDLTRLSEEFYDTNIGLDELQNAAPSADFVYLEGNHEGRATRFAAEYGELDGMLSVPVSLYMQAKGDYHRESSSLRGIRWIPLSMQPFTLGAVAYLHGVFESIYHAAMTAQHLGPKCGVRCLVNGHMHGWQSFASASGFVSYACPWLGDETQPVFRSYVKGRPRPWHVGILDVVECGEFVTVTPIFIRNGAALVGGRLIAQELAA